MSGDEIADNDIADRLSNLPEEILLEILSYLSLKECSASSILSTTWRTLWTELPSLDLDDRILARIEGYEFRDIIRNVLRVRSEAPVHRLRISWIQDCLPWDVVVWISMLLGDEIQELDVCIEKGIHLPNCLFSHRTENLVCLKLKGFIVLDTRTNLFAFPSLKILELIDVLYSEEDSLSTILLYCPVVEDLKLQIGVQRLESLRVTFSISTLKRFQCRLLSEGPTCEFKIDTPALKFFNFRGRLDKKFEWKCFQRLPNQELQIEPEDNVKVEEYVDRISSFLEPLVAVNLVALNLYTTILLCRAYDQEITFDQLSSVKFFDGLGTRYEPYIRKFLTHVPRLKLLIFALSGRPTIYDRSVDFLDDEVPEWKLQNLATFSCEGVLGLSSEFDQISQMIVAATDLKLLKIFIESRLSTRKKAKIRQNITQMKEISQECQIQFEENQYEELDMFETIDFWEDDDWI